jgi:hypothetical protein
MLLDINHQALLASLTVTTDMMCGRYAVGS